MWSAIKIESQVAWITIKTNVLAEVQLRAAFFLQVVGMMFNDTAFVLLWYFFFEAFGSINGWTAKEVVAFQGVAAFSFGLAFGFLRGAKQLSKYVDNGTFDNFLLSPRNLYIRILTSDSDAPSIGDMIFGILLIAIYIVWAKVTLLQTAMLISLLIPATLIMINFALVTSLVAFLMPDAVVFAENLFDFFLSPSLYPSATFPSALRFFFIFIVPSIAVGGLPIEAIQHLNWNFYVIIWALGIFWLLLATQLLNLAVKRYESGNLTGARA